ncbi:MAG TPA: DUF4386 family protein [Chthoniobacterales bacterium]|nr:DUF4386 family protein [Chthoniobacterales bacterium]
MTLDFKGIGRIAGILLLAQALIAIPVYTEIGMMSSIISPDFLVQAAGNAARIRTALVLTFLLAGVTLAVALVALPVFRPASERMFWLYFGLCVAGVATAAMESVVVREMLAMSINYPQSGKAAIYEALAPVVRSEWSAAHFFNLASGHVKALVFFLILYRFHFIPRLLAGIGVSATVLSTAGTTAALLGVPFSYLMIAPTGLVQLATTLWLIWKGFSEPVTLGGAEGHRD